MSDSGATHTPIRSSPPPVSPQRYRLDELTPSTDPVGRSSEDTIAEIELDLRIELGRTRMRLEDVLQLRPGSVITLDNGESEPVDVYINNRMIARGDILVMNERFCVRITELVGSV